MIKKGFRKVNRKHGEQDVSPVNPGFTSVSSSKVTEILKNTFFGIFLMEKIHTPRFRNGLMYHI